MVPTKPSCVPWVGDLPLDWSVVPMFSIAGERTTRNTGMIEDNLLSLSYGRIVPKDINSESGLLPESFETYQIVEPGDIVFRLTDLQNDQRSLRTAVVPVRGIITAAYTAVEPRGVRSGFLAFLVRAYDVLKVFYTMGGGMRQTMKYEDLRRLPVVLPPADVQDAIVAFLERETNRIDALIEKKIRFIELLREKRQVLIAASVSGWPVRPLKYAIDFLTSGPRGWSDLILDGASSIFVQSGDLTDEMSVNFDSASRIVAPAGAEADRTRLRAGDVVVCITGGNTGRVALATVAPAPAYINQHLCLVRPSSDVLRPDFLALVLHSRVGRDHFEQRQYGLKEGLSLADVGDAPIPLPPLADQQRIVGICSELTMRIQSLIVAATRSVDLLRERRAALITAAVTGQIDVGAGIPDEEAEPA